MSDKFRYARVFQGEISQADYGRIRQSELFRHGDAVLVWVNEGDLYRLGEDMGYVPDPDAVLEALKAAPQVSKYPGRA